MESVQCVLQSPDPSHSLAKPCQEYVLAGEGVLFHLQTISDQNAVLPVGKSISYRVEEGRFYLRLSGHDREFRVVAMEPVDTPGPAVHSAKAINHLQ